MKSNDPKLWVYLIIWENVFPHNKCYSQVAICARREYGSIRTFLSTFLMPAYVVRGKVIFILGNVCSPSVCVWGYSVPGLGRGRYPIPGLDGGGGVPHPRSGWWGCTIPGLDGGGYPIPGLDGGEGVPPPKSGLDGGYLGYPPGPGLDNGGTWGTPLPWLDGDLGWGTPPPPQHSEHLLRGRRNASCIHAGWLSCFCGNFLPFSLNRIISYTWRLYGRLVPHGVINIIFLYRSVALFHRIFQSWYLQRQGKPFEMILFRFCVFLNLLIVGSFEAAPKANDLGTLMERVKILEVSNISQIYVPN